MNSVSDYIKECPHGFPECALCGKVSNKESVIREHVEKRHMNRSKTSQSTLTEVQKA